MGSQALRVDPAEILDRLLDCLSDLDEVGAGLAAIHLATAIETLRAQFGIADNSSIPD